MRRDYTKHGDVLTFKFYVPGFSQEQLSAFIHEVLCQGEASDDHPEAIVVDQGVELLDVDQERREFVEDNDLDADAEYGRDSERDYDPDEDRTP